MLGQEIEKTCVVGEGIDRPRLDLGKHALVEVLDLKRHATMLAKMLIGCNMRIRDDR